MSDEIDYITRRLDVVAEKVSDMSITLGAHIAKFDVHLENVLDQRAELKRNTDILDNNTLSLQDHIKRTDLLEQYVKKIDERFTPLELDQIRSKAVTEWLRNRIFFLAKLGGAVTSLGALAALARLLVQHLAVQ